MTPVQLFRPQEYSNSWTTSMVWNQASSSQSRWSQKASFHSWMSFSSGIRMAPFQRLCTGKLPTQTVTWTLCPTIHWPTTLRWSRRCTAGQGQSAQMSLRRIRKPDTSDRPSSTMGTPKGLFNPTPHQPAPGTRTTSPRAQWSASPMYVVCPRQYAESSLH